ncbi:hypothetical protein K488DRAFT_77551 [Vararia minispora EC-137]|uniref:Uncharacterized protein n=1 Tax=Vararia minispora EC-137 TaxID=1314806 RepID=A0ACB8QR26_9AGAM|nr:hypothetical protein K488DRAFT_77551 [Vararia minispora EC-137]
MTPAIPVSRSTSPSSFAQARSQWQNPSDVLTILQIIGGDIVQKAIAQLSGSEIRFGPVHFTMAPVAFSFGFVAYSVSALLSAVGDGRLLPSTDIPSVLVNASNGNIRTNKSWILGRLLRDNSARHRRGERGLTITLYHTSSTDPIGVPDYDWVFYGGWIVILIQHAIAAAPGIIHSNWLVLLLTATGTVLALAAGALPQWKLEKWAARAVAPSHSGSPRREVISLTQGNGSKHVIVIISEQCGVRFEDLAAARDAYSLYTVPIIAILTILWIAHLLTVAGLDGDAWYWLAIGMLGMAQNFVAAGAPRSAGALGVHLHQERVIHEDKVFTALQAVEELEHGVGLSLLPVFFPGSLREEEIRWRDAKRAVHHAKTAASLPAGEVRISPPTMSPGILTPG